MKSFVLGKDDYKNNSVQEPTERSSPANVNPFFQYVSNSKPSANLQVNKPLINQIPPSINEKTNFNQPNQRKNSDTVADPRKTNMHYMNKINETQEKLDDPKSNPVRFNYNGLVGTSSRNSDLREKRSRSRQINQTRNRENSSDSNLRQKKDQHYRKTKLCPLFDKGECKIGSQCHFAHGKRQLRGLPNFVKTRICIAFKNGQCKYSSKQCNYAHGEHQLRSLRHDGGFTDSIPKRNQQRSEHKQQRVSRRDRDSGSAHRKEKQKKSNSRQYSRERKKDNPKHQQSASFYKKDLAINKQYEKYLYAGDQVKIPQFNNDSYMIPNGKVSNSFSYDPYGPDSYSINYSKDAQTSAVPSALNAYPNVHRQLDKSYRGTPKQMYSYGEPEDINNYAGGMNLNNKGEFNLGKGEFNLNNKDAFNYPKGETYPRSFPPQKVMLNPISTHNFKPPEYPVFYQSQSEPFSQFSKDSYRKYNKPVFSGQSYISQPGNNVYQKESKLSQPLNYYRPQKNVSARYPSQLGKQQPFYRNEAYSPAFYETKPSDSFNTFSTKNGSNTYPGNGQSPYSSNGLDPYPSNGPSPYPSNGPNTYPSNVPNTYPNNVPNTYPNNVPNTYPSNGPGPYPNQNLELYPALDNNISNQKTSRYPNNFNKDKYPGYSNNHSNR